MHSARMLALRLLLPPVHRCPSSASDSRVSSHASAERLLGRLDSKCSDAMRAQRVCRTGVRDCEYELWHERQKMFLRDDTILHTPITLGCLPPPFQHGV
eukprot:scaffold8830_cov56-Cylindrotheca_fusiformis.AAC.1